MATLVNPSRAGARAAQTNACPGPLRVMALGPFRAFVGTIEIAPSDWKSRKALLLLQYLLSRAVDRVVQKDAVMEALWPEQDPAYSGQSLRAAISALRRTLEPDLPARTASAYLVSRDGQCGLRLGARGFFDAREFEHLVGLGAEHERHGSRTGAAMAYEKAAALYRGDLFEEEVYAEWASGLRQRLRESYTRALLRLASFSLGAGNVDGASDCARRAIEVDSGLEPAYRVLVRCHALSGEWGSVRAVYERYRQAMQDLAVPAPPGLQVLLDQATRGED